MIARMWHGYTSEANALLYQDLLLNNVIPAIEAAHNCSAEVFSRKMPDVHEVEFVTICYFQSHDEVRAFAGKDWERAVVPMEAQGLLSGFDEWAAHYDLRSARRRC